MRSLSEDYNICSISSSKNQDRKILVFSFFPYYFRFLEDWVFPEVRSYILEDMSIPQGYIT